MIKTIFILDISGSMSDAQIKKGMDIIYTKGILLSGREPPVMFCWNPLETRHLYQLVAEIKKSYPESSIHLVSDGYINPDDLILVDQLSEITL